MRSEIYSWLDELQGKHWWLRARDAIVISQFQDYLSDNLHILEIGFGAGGMLGVLSEYGKVWGMDNPEAIQRARKRYPEIDLCEGELPNKIPFSKSLFDRIVMLDVLEHIDDDIAALRSALYLLRPGGLLFFTVPALKMLWSKHDELAMHKRRYKKNEIIGKVKEASYKIIKCSYFNMYLFLPILIAKKISGITKGHVEKVRFPHSIEKFLYKVFRSEKYLLKIFDLPIGVSIICIAQKNG